MNLVLESTVVLLLIAIVVALAARRLRLPYTVGLVLTGILLSVSHSSIELRLTHEFIYDVILPPLLFEAAINLHWRELRRDLLPVLVLATFGVVLSGFFVAWGIWSWLGWPWGSALVFGALISATDPVAVIAMFKDMRATGRIRLLVEAESLFNDGVAAVFLALVLAALSSGALAAGPMIIGRDLLLTAGGGILVGGLSSLLAGLLAGRTNDHLVETAVTAVAAYGSFLLAEQLHLSGVLATVTAGLFMANGPLARVLSERGRTFVVDFWEFFAFLANSLVFLLIGLRTAMIPFGTLGAAGLAAIVLLTILGRALSVYPLCLPFAGSRWAIAAKDQHVLWWGGLRGALGLALALSLPPTIAFANQIVVATFGTVAFSVLVQGLTMPLLMNKLRVPKT